MRSPPVIQRAIARIALVGLAALALASGCRTTKPLARDALANLDGYLASEPERARRELVTYDGEPLTFDRGTVLLLDPSQMWSIRVGRGTRSR
jgi:hypothetical protein